MHEHSFSFFSIFFSCNNDEEAVPKLFKRFSSLRVAQDDAFNARGRQIILLSCHAVACNLPPYASIVNVFMGDIHTNSNCDIRYSSKSPSLGPSLQCECRISACLGRERLQARLAQDNFYYGQTGHHAAAISILRNCSQDRSHNLQVTGFLSYIRRSLLMQAPHYSGRQKLPQRISPIIVTQHGKLEERKR